MLFVSECTSSSSLQIIKGFRLNFDLRCHLHMGVHYYVLSLAVNCIRRTHTHMLSLKHDSYISPPPPLPPTPVSLFSIFDGLMQVFTLWYCLCFWIALCVHWVFKKAPQCLTISYPQAFTVTSCHLCSTTSYYDSKEGRGGGGILSTVIPRKFHSCLTKITRKTYLVESSSNKMYWVTVRSAD